MLPSQTLNICLIPKKHSASPHNSCIHHSFDPKGNEYKIDASLMVDNEGSGASTGHQVMLAAEWAACCRAADQSSWPPLVQGTSITPGCKARCVLPVKKVNPWTPASAEQQSEVVLCQERQDDSELLLNYRVPSKWQPSAVTQAARQVPKGDNLVSWLNEVEEAPYSLSPALIAAVSINFGAWMLNKKESSCFKTILGSSLVQSQWEIETKSLI